mmetsp:Transcript_74734/g.118923  ORF Transcript_74734/g.118923 Transcript_74734/m.118923 type:complete len:180 (+) Transcript_74734:306-845(+)
MTDEVRTMTSIMVVAVAVVDIPAADPDRSPMIEEEDVDDPEAIPIIHAVVVCLVRVLVRVVDPPRTTNPDTKNHAEEVVVVPLALVVVVVPVAVVPVVVVVLMVLYRGHDPEVVIVVEIGVEVTNRILAIDRNQDQNHIIHDQNQWIKNQKRMKRMQQIITMTMRKWKPQTQPQRPRLL